MSSEGIIDRRQFMAGAAAAAFTVVAPGSVRGTQANSRIELGMIGCGGRGKWIAPLFEKHGSYKFVACADYYPEHADQFGSQFGVDASRRYSTLSGYKRLLEGKLDAVVIQSPPYFHPEQTAASIEAGRHVFLSKPIAVDVPGCLSVGESGKKGTESKLVVLVDFQTRNNEFYREAVKRVQRGDIGRMVCGEARYPWGVGNFPGPETPEDRLRRWYCIKALSGDFINEQSIHAVDVATWFLGADPVRACGAAGSRNLRSYGDINDYFSVIYTFPNDFILSFTCNQATPGVPDEIICRIYGSKGTADTDYFSHVWIRGTDPYEPGEIKGLYTSGAVNNIRDFHKFVTEGHYGNETVRESVRSNLTTILGRTAGYFRRTVTWAELLKRNERLEPDLSGLRA
jgi:myo-inositol 2-dehydrogenase / D-chiro-inositol 1-dehydrogenase